MGLLQYFLVDASGAEIAIWSATSLCVIAAVAITAIGGRDREIVTAPRVTSDPQFDFERGSVETDTAS